MTRISRKEAILKGLTLGSGALLGGRLSAIASASIAPTATAPTLTGTAATTTSMPPLPLITAASIADLRSR